jgi:hypothetical protein
MCAAVFAKASYGMESPRDMSFDIVGGQLIAHTHVLPGILPESTGGEFALNAGFSKLHLQKQGSSASNFCLAVDSGVDSSFLACAVSLFKVAMLYEPREINQAGYAAAEKHMSELHLVLTNDPELLDRYPQKTQRYPTGGSFLLETERLRGAKIRNVSISASKKKMLDGHRLRHQVVSEFRGLGLVPMGGGYKKYDSWATPYARFRFSVVIENSAGPFLFTEKLIHSLLFRCIPVYWGATELPHEFSPEGILRFRDIDELHALWPTLNRKKYRELEPFLARNQSAALEYCSTDLNVQRSIASFFGVDEFSKDSATNYFADHKAVLSGSAPFAPIRRIR